MVFKLTQEQIDEIISEYGGSKQTIKRIEEVLNSLNIIQEEEDYIEIIINTLSQRVTNSYEVSACTKRKEAIEAHMSLSEIIACELERRYGEFENINPIMAQKAKVFVEQKKRHN